MDRPGSVGVLARSVQIPNSAVAKQPKLSYPQSIIGVVAAVSSRTEGKVGLETLDAQFVKAKRNVSVSGSKQDAAKAAHEELREILERDAQLCEWGIDTILIGSYARLTARYPGKDVDVFLRFLKLSERSDPATIYESVQRVLVDEYGLKGEDEGGRVTLQARSLKVDFDDSDNPDGDSAFSIDAVPAVPWGDNWGIPNHDSDKWRSADDRWIETNPVAFNQKTEDLSIAAWSPTVDGDNAYRPIVRLLRQVRHMHLGDSKPGGLFVEVAAYHAWNERGVSGSSWAQLLEQTLVAVASRFRDATDNGLLDPVLGTALQPALQPDEWTNAADVFDVLATQATKALQANRCMAAKLWRDILGVNDRGPVLPLPEGCDANGAPITGVTAVGALGSDDPRGFA